MLHCHCCYNPYCSSQVSLVKNRPSSVEVSDEGLGLNNGAKQFCSFLFWSRGSASPKKILIPKLCVKPPLFNIKRG